MTRTKIILTTLLLLLSMLSPTIAQKNPQSRNCITCGMATGADAIIEQFKGRWVAICPGQCNQDWQENPDVYFLKMQSHGALFDESSLTESAVDNTWLYLGCYMLLGLMFGAMTSYIALTNGHNPAFWFFIGLLLNVLGLIAILCKKQADLSIFPEGIPSGFAKVPTTYAPSPCPTCHQENHPAAPICSHCGETLNPTVEAETKKC